MNSTSAQPKVTFAERAAESAAASEIRQHRQACERCGTDERTPLCPVGMAIVARTANAAERPQISADAQFIAGKIVKHMWIIFVLLPLVGLILLRLLK